eukprot:1159769-Pelagomonas_calceolata.AAC.1
MDIALHLLLPRWGGCLPAEDGTGPGVAVLACPVLLGPAEVPCVREAAAVAADDDDGKRDGDGGGDDDAVLTVSSPREGCGCGCCGVDLGGVVCSGIPRGPRVRCVVAPSPTAAAAVAPCFWLAGLGGPRCT